MTMKLVGQVGGVVLLTDYDFSWASDDDLARMLTDCVSAGFEEGTDFIGAVREEIKSRKPLEPFTEDRMPPYKHRHQHWYQYDSLAHRDSGIR